MNIFSKNYAAGSAPEPAPEPAGLGDELTKQGAAETSIEEYQQDGQSAWEVIVRWSLFIIAFITPLWFLPLTINPVDGNKLFLVSILAIVGFIAWLGMAVYQGAIHLPRSLPFFALGIWVIAYFLAALFSTSPEVSFWGTTATSFFYVLISALIALLAAVTFRTSAQVRSVYMLLLAAAGTAALFMVIQTLLSIDIFQWEFAKQRTFHPIGSWNTVGIYFGFVLVSTAVFLSGGMQGMTRRMRILVAGTAIVSLILAAAVNFRILWVGVGLLSIIFLAYHFSQTDDHRARMRFTVAPLAMLLGSVLLYLSVPMINALTLNISPPVDVTPNASSSFHIAGEVLRERPVLGVGPNLFGHAWDQYKDPTVNNTVFWRLRFATASSFATTLLTTTGILGASAFLLFIGAVLWMGVSLLHKLRWDDGDHRLIGAAFFGFLFLLFSWFVYPLTVTGSILTFFMFGLLAAHMRIAGITPFVQVPIRADSAKGFVAALVIIFLMVFGVVGIYVTSQKQVAAIIYGRGVAALTETGSVNEAENLFRRAAEFDGSRDLYYRAIAQMSAVKLQRSIANADGQQAEDVRNAFQLALSNAIAGAQAAVDVDSGNAINWRILGQIYESVIPFVGGSADAALEAYGQAVTQSPRDPVLRDDLARVYIALGNYVKARELLEEAIRLKSDYATAHFRLAQIAAIKGNVEEAVSNTERAALSAPNDIGILFQLGVLYYQQEEYESAQQVLLRAVDINTNYSNARYFLGLAYAALEQREAAIEQFTHIAELNPDNAEVQLIRANLENGRDVLEGVSSSPLDRGQVPVQKESEEIEQDELQEEGIPAGDDIGGGTVE